MKPSPRSADFSPHLPAAILATLLLTVASASAYLDTNANNLSDIWEKKYNNNQLLPPTVPTQTAASLDPDGDGRSNAAEWAAGTNPLVAEAPSAFQLAASPSAVEGVHYLTMPTTDGKTYQFQTAADLATWQAQGAPYLGDGRPLRDIVQATLVGGSTPSKLFWRTVVTDPDDDGDGLTNWEERELKTDPANPDSDGDGLGDKVELLTLHTDGNHLDPLNRDTDGDGLWDGTDTAAFINANDPMLGGDPDGGNLAAAFSTNLEGFWDFETHADTFPRTFPDRTGNNRTATGGLDGSLQDGMPSKCTRIGPGNVTLPVAVVQNKSNQTIAGWFRFGTGTIAGTTTHWQIVWSLYDQQGTGPAPSYAPLGQGTVLMVRGLAASGGNPAQEQWFIGKYEQTYYWNEYPYINTSPKTVFDGRYFTRPSGSTDDTRWHHIALTRAASANLQITYIDGALQDSGPIKEGSVAYDANTRFIFGNIHPGNSATQLSEGYIDRLRVHSRTLDSMEIVSLYRQDLDHDLLWDITEANTRVNAYATTGHPDPTANPPVTASLAGYQLSPYYANNPAADHDEDGTDNLTEQAGGTKPTEPDSDGDGLPDGWETASGLNPNEPYTNGPGTDRDDEADPDNDELSNLTEYLNGTDPAHSNSDGDLTGDAAEIAQGSDPNDAGDNGQPPPAAAESISFHVYGDYTQWEATVTGKGPDDWRVRRFRMNAPGEATTQSLGLRTGNTYEYSLKYLSTLPDQNVPWYCWESSIIDPMSNVAQTAPAFTLAGKWLVDNSSALLADHSHSQGTNNVKKRQPVTLAPSDLDIIVPGTEDDDTPAEIAEDKEDTEGGVINVNWDDDNNSGGPGVHGKVDYKSDFEDPPGTKDENDLIRLKLHKAPGATARLKYANTHVKLWRNADRSGEITSEDTVFDLADDRTVYAEGLKLTPSGQSVEIQMQIKSPADTTFLPGDTIRIHVATPTMFFSGVNPEMSGEEADSILAAISKTKTVLGKRLVDKRENTLIVKGMNRSGEAVFYSVDCFSAIAVDSPEMRSARPLTSDKEMKMAMGTEQAHVVYGGHSNFGLGPNFMASGTKKIADYFNISGHGHAGIILWEKDGLAFSNPMHQADHGGLQFQVADSEIKGTVQNQWVTIGNDYQIRRFPTTVLELTKKTAAWPIPPYHFTQGSDDDSWVTIVSSTGDLPTFRYASVFMGSCNSGRHFGTSLNHGVFLYTTDETRGIIDDYNIEVDAQSTSYIVIEGIILGKSWQNITGFMNAHRMDKDSTPADLYRTSAEN